MTNVARSAAVNEADFSDAVTRNWLTYLLQNSDELSPTDIYGMELPRRRADAPPLSECTWLEEFDALQIFEFASKPWFYHLAHVEAKSWRADESKIEEWTQGGGKGLSIGWEHGSLSTHLLSIVVPRVAALRLCAAREEFSGPEWCIVPPQVGWKEKLGACRDYIANPVEWGLFVEFGGKLKRLLYARMGERLNIDYEPRVMESFKTSEAHELKECLEQLVWTKTKGFQTLSSTQAVLFQRAQDTLGDLLIGDDREAWRIDSLAKPDALD